MGPSARRRSFAAARNATAIPAFARVWVSGLATFSILVWGGVLVKGTLLQRASEREMGIVLAAAAPPGPVRAPARGGPLPGERPEGPDASRAPAGLAPAPGTGAGYPAAEPPRPAGVAPQRDRSPI